MPSMVLHAIAALLMVGHAVLRSRGPRPRLTLCADAVMVLAMLDMAAGTAVLPPVVWLGVAVATALLLAAMHGGTRRHREGQTTSPGSWAPGALTLVLMGAVQLVAAPHGVGVEVLSGHHSASSAAILPLVLLGLGAHTAVSVVASVLTRGAWSRVAHLAAAGATAAMGAAVLLS